MRPTYKSGEELLKEIQMTDMPFGSVAVWHLGQSGVIIKGGNQDGYIVIDPYLTFSIEERSPNTEFKRGFEPPLTPEQLTDASGILITHSHDDHLDLETIIPIAQHSSHTYFALPVPDVHVLEKKNISSKQIIGAKAKEKFRIKGFEITPISAAHVNYERDDEGNDKYLGFIIEVNGVKVFNCGDSVVTEELISDIKSYRPHIAILPINGQDYFRTSRWIVGNMNYRDAVDFGVTIGADMILPVHYDMFANNRENPAYFVDYIFHQYPNQKFHMMVPGERFIYYK
nr:MBL fold metallo-hydrolase [Paenibacillus bovis]